VAEPDFGSDIAGTADLDPDFGEVTGVRAVAESVARRFHTPQAGLFYAPGYVSLDLRDYLGQATTDAQRNALGQLMESAALQDERVDACRVTLEFAQRAGLTTITVEGETALGPFVFVLAASPALVTLLSLQAG
jgi:hypothetical protein